MNKSHMNPNDLVGEILCKIRKEDAYFIYFTLEAHEGLCCFSTIPNEKGQSYRLMQIFFSYSLKKQVDHLLSQLLKKYSIEILEELIRDNLSTPL